jgi:MOSC domain-containing protein YiiM
MMRIVSLNVGLPRTVAWRGQQVTTGIFKQPVKGPILLRQFNLVGDRQADLKDHGGQGKAVYAYPSEHYEFWHKELPQMELPWGMFGENLTTEGLMEENTHIGDRFRIGEALVMVTQPRIPCYKLGVKFGRDDIVRRFLESGRSGIYFSVMKEGMISALDPIDRIHHAEGGITVADINRAYVHGNENISLMRRAVRLGELPAGIRDRFVQQLSSIDSSQ